MNLVKNHILPFLGAGTTFSWLNHVVPNIWNGKWEVSLAIFTTQAEVMEFWPKVFMNGHFLAMIVVWSLLGIFKFPQYFINLIAEKVSERIK